MLDSKIVGKGGRKARRLSLTRMPALFPLFRHRRRFLDCATQTKGSDAVSEQSTGIQELKVRFALRDGGTNV